MGLHSRKLWIALVFLCMAQASPPATLSAWAQWNIVAPNAVPAVLKYGAMQYKDGILWAGSTALVFSLDSGKTWEPTSFPGSVIYDIFFANRRFGVIATQGYSYRTRDGGKTWFQIADLPTSISSIICTGDEREIFAVHWPDDKIYISSDSGNSWHTTLTHPSIMTMTRASDGVLYVVSNYSKPGIVSASTDSGATWKIRAGFVGPDCWSIVANNCNPAQLYVTTENLYDVPGWSSSLFASSDRGATWVAGYSDPTEVAGSVATFGSAAFAGTLTKGILRSTDYGTSWQNTGGSIVGDQPNGAGDNRGICMVNEDLAFALDQFGNIWETVNGGGDSIPITHAGTLTTVSPVLFDRDTVSCDSLSQSVFFVRSGCAPPSISGWSITGTDSASFQSGNLTYDSLVVTLHGGIPGTRNAQLVLTLDNGSSDTVELNGMVMAPPPNTLRVSPATPFQFDTISCSSITRSLIFRRSGCTPPSVVAWSITGADSASYTASNLSYDSVLVTLHGKENGPQHAQLILLLDDSSSDTVALAGFIDIPPNILSVSPSTLFSDDTISCDSLTRTLVFSRSGCLPPTIFAWSIVGADSASFRASNLSNDSILVTLYGIKQGSQSAQLILALDNGSSDTVALAGYVNILPRALTLSTADVNTDTVGGTVAVPITIEGLKRPENVELVLHYDGSVDYLGSFSPSGVPLDVPEPGTSRSILYITGAMPDAIAGYSMFNVFNDSSTVAHASFNSLQVLTANSPCEYSAPIEAVTSTITAPSGCGAQTLSRLVHLGEMPELSVSPNPTTGVIWISSNAEIEDATIEVFDMLGMKQGEIARSKISDHPLEVRLPSASGVYTIRIQSALGTRMIRVIEAQ